jgi:hypothetical protein
VADPQGSITSGTALAADSTETRSGSIPQTNRRGGPKTVAGKRRSALNALRSGLYSDTIVTRNEDRDEYLRFARAIVAGLDVQTALEMAFAERVVSALWRSRRLRRYEQAHLNIAAKRVASLLEDLEAMERDLAACESESDASSRRLVRDQQARRYEAALAWSFVLPDGSPERHIFDWEPARVTGPAKVLEDTERRLDRQVSRALADFEAARRLRP